MTFPNDWPQGCPPEDVHPTSGLVYRIVHTNPATAADFVTFAELGRFLRKPPDCPCMPVGLSVFQNGDDAAWMARKHPYLGKFLASGVLSPADGVIKPTKGQRPTHMTWWPAAGCDRVQPFTACQEVA